MVFVGLAGNIIVVIISIIILMMCAEIAVKKVLAFLRYFGYSTLFGGLVIFSIATSFPEIFSHLAASFGILSQTLDYRIASATVLGANIGSDVIQQTLVLGIVVFLMGSLVFKKSFLLTAYLPMIGTTLLTLILGWDRTLSRLDGIILLVTFFVYIGFLWKRETHKQSSKEKDVHIMRDSIIIIAAMAVMLFSAHFLLRAVHQIVSLTGIGGSLIGVVSLGVAAAAPELFTAISGLRQKAVGISLGTLIGSNITNPLVAIGLGSLISTYWVPLPLIMWDLPMETITAALLLGYLLLTKRKLGRAGALYLMALYFVYLAIRVMFFYVD